jgi:hypothetical protein
VQEYRTLGLLHEYDHAADAWDALIDRWQQRRNTDATVAMTTDLRWAVRELNERARSRLVAAGEVARKSRTFTHPNTGESVQLAVGDYVLLKDNDGAALQPDGSRVVLRNGMRATVTRVTREGVSVRLDDEHIGRDGQAERWLTAHYAGTSVRHGWATTCDAAEGATVDHGLYLATDRASLERGYVAVSRGRKTNEIFAATDSGWERELGETRAHEPAHRQEPAFDRQAVQALERDEKLSARERWLHEREADRQRAAQHAREIEQERERQRGRAIAI